MTTDETDATRSRDDELGILQRRRIEANIIAPIYRVMCRELGTQQAAAIIREAIADDARRAGARFAAAEPEAANLTTFIAIQDLWTRDDALVTETRVATATEFEYDVTRCAYAEMYREMGLAEIGTLLSCVRDAEFIRGYDPDIEMTRTHTIMEGASHCDFHYRRRG